MTPQALAGEIAAAPARSAVAAIEITDLARSYGAVRAVAGVSLRVQGGESVALLGPNGAGKTTLISMLLDLLRPDRGRVQILGGEPRRAVAEGRVGAMLQDGGLMPGARVEELLRLMHHLYPNPMGVEELVQLTQLEGLRRHRVDGLSGGETQRVRAAIALIGNPDLLVLDEPTAGMDVEARRGFWQSMDEQASRGRTLLFSTHNLQEADQHCDRVVVLARGRLVADGTPAAVKSTVGLRALRFTLAGAGEGDLGDLPGAARVSLRGERFEVLSRDTDAALRALLIRHPGARDIEVTGVDLEDAFLALTDTGDGDAGRAAAGRG